MIHLDRNHHPSPLDKQNLILPDNQLLSWSAVDDLSHDDQFLQDGLHQKLPHQITDAETPSRPGPVTPVDAQDPVLDHIDSPASPADGNSTSPTRDRSSSLSPAPETGEPDSPPIAEEKEAPVEAPRKEEEEEEEEEEPQVAQASRLSTPLSELSPPPDQDDEQENGGDDTKATSGEGSAEGSKAGGLDAAQGEGRSSDTAPPTASTELSTATQSHDTNSVPSPKSHITSSLESPSSVVTSPTHANDPKVVSILELNMELLKVCMEFQSRGFATSEVQFQQYASRLQANLTWLAAAADHSRQGNHSNMLLPIMEPPPRIEFGSMDRIQQIYTELPSIFAKEIARRNANSIISTTAPNMAPPPANLKRERTDELPADLAMKRRNTGETKPPSVMMPPPAQIPPIPHAPPTQFSLPMSNGGSGGDMPVPRQLAQAPHSSPRLSEAQMASLNPSLMNTAEAQLAASTRERARQAQIHAAQQQAARQMSPPSSAALPQAMQSNRHMVNNNPNVNATAGPSNLGNPTNPTTNAAYQQLYSILQTPNHQFVQYMMKVVPGFQTLPVGVQVQKMMQAQQAIQARQQQEQLQQQQQQQHPQQQQQHQQHQQQNPQQMGTPIQQRPGSTMPNPMQQQMHGIPMQNNMGMSGGQFPGPSASPVSANPPQSPMSQQAQMFGLGNPGQNGSGPGGGGGGSGGGGGGGGMDPRMMLHPGMNMNNLTPHQRQQLLLIQQSRMGAANANMGMNMNMGGGGGGGPSSGPMGGGQMSPQQMAYAQQQQERMREQQRLAQMQAAAAGGMGGTSQGSASPMPLPMPGTSGDFPALRSNSAIPGIARSTRSPSDGAQSPMTPRVQQRGPSMGQEDYQRLMAQQQMQASRAMAARSPVYSQQQQHAQQQQQQNQQMGGGWQQQQSMHQQQGMQMGQSGSYGMSPPSSAYGGPGGGVPSPTNSQGWGQQGQGGYPFAASPDHMQMRHMSGTPGPQMQPQNLGASPPAEQSNEFDIFSWAS